MYLAGDKKYEGWGNCLTHSIAFKIRYGGEIKLSWNKQRHVPSFRVHRLGKIYRFRSYNKRSFPLYFKGRTVEYIR